MLQIGEGLGTNPLGICHAWQRMICPGPAHTRSICVIASHAHAIHVALLEAENLPRSMIGSRLIASLMFMIKK